VHRKPAESEVISLIVGHAADFSATLVKEEHIISLESIQTKVQLCGAAQSSS